MTDRYPCPDKRCPGLIALEPTAESASSHTCPYCGESFQAQEIRTAPRWQTWQAEPKTNDNSHVQFWSMPIKRRLEQSTIGANQAAKRDLAAYAAIIEGGLPPIQRATAEAFTRHLMTKRELLATPASIIAQWNTQVIDAVVALASRTRHTASAAQSDLYLPGSLLPKYALIDAADKCIKECDDTPEPYLPDIVARHFRITPDRS
jgi:hypothetical protein